MIRMRHALLVLGLTAGATASAQRGFGRPDFSQSLGDPSTFYTPPSFAGNPAYDGKFTFARIKYRGYGRWSGREGPGWAHDYPDAEIHFTKILKEVTSIRPFIEQGKMQGGVLVALDDPALFRYPVSYLSEPGGWFPNDAEVKGMHQYLMKGGFVIVDDFPRGSDANCIAQFAKVLPGLKPLQLTGTEPIFDAFYKVDLNKVRSEYGAHGGFYAYFVDNDPKKRMLAILNYNNDVGESWQWSGQGFQTVDVTNEAYKLGVNYMIYALTH
jgi:hypothetical protein